jgi:type VI secretion system protein ImpA
VVALAADFFKRTEPHSPLGYTLEEVVRRGRLPLQDLLKELITEDEVRNRFLIAAGIRPAASE